MSARAASGPRRGATLHPVAWWVWALALMVAASRTTDPLLLLLALAVLGSVVALRRGDAPWARGFRYYLAIAAVVIAIRVVFRAVFATGTSVQDHVLFTLPTLHLPHWYSGVSIGGPVAVEAILTSCFAGLQLGTLLCCVGAANVLANPKRALRVLPGALYELGVAVVVALTVAPQLVESVQRVRRARRLRAPHGRRARHLRAILVPVLEDALDRSLRLAAGMDSRGYGRTAGRSSAARRTTAALLLGGLVLLCLGMFALLDAGAPRALGLPALLAGALACVVGLAAGGRRVRHSTYRPDPWRLREWVVAGGGVAGAVLLWWAPGTDAATLTPAYPPLAWPALPLVPAAALLLAGLAALAAPVSPRDTRPPRSRRRPATPARPERVAVPA